MNDANEAGVKPFDVTIATAFMALLELEGADVRKRLKPIVPALPLGPDADEAQVARVSQVHFTSFVDTRPSTARLVLNKFPIGKFAFVCVILHLINSKLMMTLSLNTTYHSHFTSANH